jgi:ribosomal protein S18 acetylase RimI-like enzyme
LTDPRPTIARVEDAEQVAALLDAFNREFDDPTPGVEVLERRVAEFIRDDTATFVVTDGLAVAQLRFRPSVWSGALDVYLEELYVAPDARGRGHGRALLEAAMAYARTRGATCMEIAVDEPDVAAIRLYESAGFSCHVEPGSEAIMRFYERKLDDE